MGTRPPAAPAAQSRPRKPAAADDPQARAVAKAVYDAMAGAGVTPSENAWWHKACVAVKGLSQQAQADAADAAAWALTGDPRGRDVHVRDLTLCRFGPVISAYRAARSASAQARASPREPASWGALREILGEPAAGGGHT
jgi:hypothetical protein